jgi:hypothetical protein
MAEEPENSGSSTINLGRDYLGLFCFDFNGPGESFLSYWDPQGQNAFLQISL